MARADRRCGGRRRVRGWRSPALRSSCLCISPGDPDCGPMAPGRFGSRALAGVRRPERPPRLVRVHEPASVGRRGSFVVTRTKRRRTTMKRLLIALVASLVLGLVGGVGPALAGDLLAPPPVADTSQTATQSNDGSNTANQSGTSEPVVISGANVAIANGSSCIP